MYTYSFNIPATYSSDDPTTPMTSTIGIVLQFQAETLSDAQAALASALANALNTTEAISLSGMYIVPPTP